MFKKFNLFFLTFMMVGKIKYAPGTIASFATCLLFILLMNMMSIAYIFLITLFFFLYSFIAINNSYDEFKSDDPQEIVIDEVVGQMLTLLAIPIYETLCPLPLGYYCLGSFLLFRLFDIWKPYPVNYVDANIKGSLGIMLDDVFASIYSFLVLCLIFYFLGG